MGDDPQPPNNSSGGEQKPPADASAATPTWPADQPDYHAHRTAERKYWRFDNCFSAIAAIGGSASSILALLALLSSQDAADSSRKSAAEAKRQADIAQDAEVRQLRSYLHLTHGSWQEYPPQTPGSGKQYGAEVYIGHAGATPAYKIRIDATILVGRYLLTAGEDLGNPLIMGGGGVTRKEFSIVYGNTPITVSVANPFDADAYRSTTTNDPLIGDRRFYMHGIIRYFDIFGLENAAPERRYEFCWVFHPQREPGGSEHGCEKYNKPG